MKFLRAPQTYVLSALIILLVAILAYCFVGTSGNIDEIKARAPLEITERGWEMMRYEGWRYGSFGNHGGKVWYHVRNIDNHDIQYRVMVTLWGGELHYTYGQPERLNRFNVKY
jgi:hypothetical protein